MGASTAALIVVRKERELVTLFTTAGATSPVGAKTLAELNVHHEGLALRRLRSRAVIRETGGRFYVDLESWAALRRSRQRLILVLVLIAAVLSIAASLGAFKSIT